MKKALAATALAATLLAGSALPSFADVVSGAGTQASPAVLSNYGTEGSLFFPIVSRTNPSGLVTEGKGAFTYNYYFQLDTPATLTGITASSSTVYKGLPNLSFSSFEIVGLFGAQSVSGSTASFYPGVTNSTYTLAANTTYDLIVKGTVSNGIGKFNGNLSVSAVPLPTSVALFGTALLGLGAFGAIRRRKEAAVAAV